MCQLIGFAQVVLHYKTAFYSLAQVVCRVAIVYRLLRVFQSAFFRRRSMPSVTQFSSGILSDQLSSPSPMLQSNIILDINVHKDQS